MTNPNHNHPEQQPDHYPGEAIQTWLDTRPEHAHKLDACNIFENSYLTTAPDPTTF